MNNATLKNATTEQLMFELIQRGAKLVNAGPYCEYQIKRKYSNTDRAEYKGNAILLPKELLSSG